MTTRILVKQRVNSLLLLTLSFIFIWFFQVTKHDPAFIAINPFAEDPFDATASFGTLFALFVAVAAIVRALNPQIAISTEKKLFLLRTQIMGVLAVGITLLMDMVAMGRYPAAWLGKPESSLLMLLVASMIFATASLALLAYFSYDEEIGCSKRNWRIAVMSLIAGSLIMALFPRGGHASGVIGAISAILVGIIVLFTLIRTIVIALVPYPASDAKRKHVYWWPQVITFGLVLGFVLSQIEALSEIGHLGLFSPVMLFFTLMGCVGVCIGYAFLAKPLGFYGDKK